MHTKQGLERLVFFSDAVAAIAITLIILPLVDSARNLGTASVASFLADNVENLAAAALSFVVIASFWRGHHALFDRVTGYTTPIVLLDFVWLAGIVFLPLPTVLIVIEDGDSDVAGPLLYIGTMLVSLTAISLLQTVARRSGLLRESDEAASERHWGLVVLMAVAFLLALVVPGVGMKALFVLVLAYPLRLLRMPRRHPAPERAPDPRTEP